MVWVALEEVGVGKLRFSDEIGVSGVGIGVLGERFVPVDGHEEARRVRDRAGWIEIFRVV